MKIDHKNAMKLWVERFGKGVTKAKDRRGRIIVKTAFGDINSEYGWNIHHKNPQKAGGTNIKENLEIVHWETHAELNGQKK
jgi:hypothetical protein